MEAHYCYEIFYEPAPEKPKRKRVNTPIQRNAANLRERKRMVYLNAAFDRLRDHLPPQLQRNSNRKEKISRIETLKCAIDYIRSLIALLHESSFPFEDAWPSDPCYYAYDYQDFDENSASFPFLE
ncbi:Fer3-like [Cichlidogyrus casuarinus]|uniref:Fer3-like n=1 Tax=Cichlidogyrus casuarinus TaxID=1844966 RepID=A0ABD2Q9V3_9PLAT